MLKALNFIHRLIAVCTADGKKRIKLALQNVLYMAVAVLCFFLLTKLLGGRFGGDGGKKFAVWLASWLGIILLFILTLEFTLLGVISQVLLFVCAFIGIFTSSQKGKNAVALVICLASFAAVAFAFYLLAALSLIDAIKNL